MNQSLLLAPLQADPWAVHFVDIERLNGHASTLLRTRLDDVRAAAAAGDLLPTTSVALLGAAGAGKTHIFARLRRVVGARASFVLVRPLLGAEPTLRLLLAEVMDQLRRPSFGGSLSQLENIVGGALAARSRFPSAGLTDASLMASAERAARIDQVLAALFALRPELEGIAEYVRRLLAFPFEGSEAKPVLAAWLSGRDIEPEAGRAAGLSGPLTDVDVLRALTALAALASTGAPLLIAFDQLENLADVSGQRVRAHGNLVAELVDQLPALTLVQLALTGEWLQHIQPTLSLPQRTRVAERTVVLEEPSVDDRRNLIRAWLERRGDEADAGNGAFPFPLADEDVERWCREPGMTPRMLLQACRRALEAPAVAHADARHEDTGAAASLVDTGLPPAPPIVSAASKPEAKRPRSQPPRVREKSREASLDGALARAWRASVRQARREVREAHADGRLLDVERIAEILEVTLAPDAAAAIVWRRGAGASPYLVGSLAARSTRGNVVLVQGSHPRSVAAALERARELASEPLLFVRQGSFEFPPTWRDVSARVAELQGLTRTCWLAPSDDVLAHGLAFASMLASARSGELTGPTGQAVSPLTLRAWSSAVLADSLDRVSTELARELGEWERASEGREAAPGAPAGAAQTEPDPARARPSPIRSGMGALLELAASRWPWSQAPLRWVREARARSKKARR